MDTSRFYTSTEGRQRLPDILQETYGSKSIAGFHRYGRVLGAVIPMEAVAMLAGQEIDSDIQERVRRMANDLLNKRGDLK